MNLFDQLYISVFRQLKNHKSRRAATYACYYVSILQIGLFLTLGVFLIKFCKQMNINFLSPGNAWLVFTILAVFLLFKNWMYYNGKKRSILFSKLSTKSKLHTLASLIFIQSAVYLLAFIISKAA